MADVFLGGTYNSNWRKKAEKMLAAKGVTYFNPVVDNWNDGARKKEEEEKKRSICNFYAITPKINGVYTIAELMVDAVLNPKKTVFCLVLTDESEIFNSEMLCSLRAVTNMVAGFGVRTYRDLDDALVSTIKMIKGM